MKNGRRCLGEMASRTDRAIFEGEGPLRRLQSERVSKVATVCRRMSLREKALQTVAFNYQLTSVAHDKVLALKAGEILGNPRT